MHRVRHPGKPDPWEAGGGAGLDGRGAAEEDEARAVSLRWRDEGERVPAAVPRRVADAGTAAAAPGSEKQQAGTTEEKKREWS